MLLKVKPRRQSPMLSIYLSMYKPSYLPDALKQQGLEFKAKNTKTLELKIR